MILKKDWSDSYDTTGCVSCFYTHGNAHGSMDRERSQGPAAVSGQLRHRHRQYPVKGQNENVVEEVNYGKMISEAIAC
jgi:hypothetical protein